MITLKYRLQVSTWLNSCCHFHLTRRGDLLSLRRNFWFMQSLLILAGDVAMNPGPFRFPCRVCTRPVRSNQRGIECDVCRQWCHVACVDVDDFRYREMMESKSFSLCCHGK